jgi:hypothetical protein
MARRHRAPYPTAGDLAAHASPLWGLTCVLGDIALRVERRRAEEQTTESTPEQRSAIGSDPTAQGRRAAR